MSTVIFDIETVGVDFDSLDKVSQEYFMKYAQTSDEIETAKNSLSFYPLTAQIVTIGMLDADTEKGYVFFQNGKTPPVKFIEGAYCYISGDEKNILLGFWEVMRKFTQFVTFNGRVFDCPFVMLRSAINQIKPTKNLMPYRYAHNVHIDLSDQLTFYDAMRRKFSLHMWCRAFDIQSPKEGGITGLQVKDLFKEERYLDIARYCGRDLVATKKLFHYWRTYLKF